MSRENLRGPGKFFSYRGTEKMLLHRGALKSRGDENPVDTILSLMDGKRALETSKVFRAYLREL